MRLLDVEQDKLMKSNFIKIAALIMGAILVGGTLLAVFSGHSSSNDKIRKPQLFNDKASNDTPVETLKTLTTEISAVEQQNQKIIEKNKALADEDKTTLAGFKSDVLAQVQQKMQKFQTGLSNNHHDDDSAQTLLSKLENNNTDKNNVTVDSDSGVIWTWISDMQNDNNVSSEVKSSKNFHPDLDFAHLIKQDAKNTNDKDTKIIPATNDPLFALQNIENTKEIKKSKPAIPYYTIPINATLTGAVAMQPIIGRIPINGKVPDPYTFKVIIGPKNLAANGIDMPEDLQGIVASGIAEGDLLGSCARGDIRSMTFVFTDGRISTTQAKDNDVLGTIAAVNGNPCILGTFHTDAPLFLGVTASLAGLQGYGNALSQSQLNHVTTTDGSSISSLLGSANKYAFGQGFSAASQA